MLASISEGSNGSQEAVSMNAKTAPDLIGSRGANERLSIVVVVVQIKTRRLTPRQLEVEAGAGSGTSWQQSLQVETGKEGGSAPSISIGQWLRDHNVQVSLQASGDCYVGP